jgi:hypothetical protein
VPPFTLFSPTHNIFWVRHWVLQSKAGAEALSAADERKRDVDHLAALQSKAGYSHAGFEHTTVPSWFSKSPLDRSPEVGKSMGPSASPGLNRMPPLHSKIPWAIPAALFPDARNWYDEIPFKFDRATM